MNLLKKNDNGFSSLLTCLYRLIYVCTIFFLYARLVTHVDAVQYYPCPAPNKGGCQYVDSCNYTGTGTYCSTPGRLCCATGSTCQNYATVQGGGEVQYYFACFLNPTPFPTLPPQPTSVPTPTTPSSGYSISGTVQDMTYGSPIPFFTSSLTIYLTQNGQLIQQVQTNIGAYTFRNITAGNYIVSLTPPVGYIGTDPITTPPAFLVTVGPGCTINNISTGGKCL